MIALARLIEAWRDAQIFENPTAPRGKLWHWLKYSQFFLLIISSLTYFLIIQEIAFFKFIFTVFAILGDAGLAYFVFEFFLNYFRTKKRNEERLARLLNSNQKDMGSGS